MLFGCYPHCKKPIQKNWKQIFPEKELRSHSPNFHINVSVSDLYIPTIDLPILLQEIQYVDRSWEYINLSQTHECGNLDQGRAISRKGIHNVRVHGIFLAVHTTEFYTEFWHCLPLEISRGL
jgi:hypothetical protein